MRKIDSFTLKTTQRTEIIDITGEVSKIVAGCGIANGLVTVFIPHTTAAVTVNENADPSVKKDLLRGLAEMVPFRQSYYQHMEGNSDAHIKASLMGSSVTLVVEQERLVLGTWQGILFCEFDGPRTRKVLVKVI